MQEMTDVVNTDEAPLPQTASGEADAMPSKAANASSAQAQSLALATKPSGATLASSSSGNIPAATGMLTGCTQSAALSNAFRLICSKAGHEAHTLAMPAFACPHP